MTSPHDKEVRYDLYCPSCEYYELEEHKDPCCVCLKKFFNEGTDKPVHYKENKKKK